MGMLLAFLILFTPYHPPTPPVINGGSTIRNKGTS